MKSYPLLALFFLFFFTSCSKGQRAADLQNEASLTPEKPVEPTTGASGSAFKNYLGINAFEWDFTDNDASVISEAKMKIMRSFGVFRHYLDWVRIENEQGKYTFNPTHAGGFYYDIVYAKCKAEGVDILADIKDSPPWLVDTYPSDQRNSDNVPSPYGLDRSDPASYIIQARAAFQFAARYGSNSAVDRNLVSVNTQPRWNGDPANQVKVGLGYVKYVECDNERDKDWKGPQAHQNAEEYAANMSAFYDGHMGKLGKNVGVKSADPTMQVVMGGLSDPDINYVIKMIEWCKKNRGTKADGTVNLCFDVINYHLYSNDYVAGKQATVGVAPELGTAAKIADAFAGMSKTYANNTPVWITESGYDINAMSPQRAIAIGTKTALISQADWNLRAAFLYARHGLKRSYFYMMDDVDINSTIQYSSSGFAVEHARRPVADYFYQTKALLGDFQYTQNLSMDPIVDVYSANGRKIYVMFVPDQKGRTAAYNLDLGTATSAKVYTLVPGADAMSVKTVSTSGGKLNITLTETPVFVEKN